MTQDDLTAAELEALQEVTRHTLLQKRIPKKIKDRLIELKYVEEKLGGPVATGKGTLYAARHKRWGL